MKLCGCGWGTQGRDGQEVVSDGRKSLKEQWVEQQARRKAEEEALGAARDRSELSGKPGKEKDGRSADGRTTSP